MPEAAWTMRRRRQLEEAEDRRSTARAWCCVVATVNVIVITAYHFDLADHAVRLYRTHVNTNGGGGELGSGAGGAPPPLTVEDRHRSDMGGAHHSAFDDQHAGLSVADAGGATRSEGDVGAPPGRRPASERPSADDVQQRLAFHADGSGVAYHAAPWSALQYFDDFVSLRCSDAPCPRDGLAAWLKVCGSGNNRSAACDAGWTSGAPRATVPPEFLLGFTLNGTTPLQYRFAGQEPRWRPGGVPSMNTKAPAALGDDFSFAAPAPPPSTMAAGGATASTGTGVVQCAPGLPKVSRDRLQRIYEELKSIPSSGGGYREAFVGAVRQLAPFFKGKRALVYGSLANPVPEVATLALAGASHVTSVEHRPVCITDPRITSVATEDFWRRALDAPAKHRFDAAVSFSVLQHDGLGRYGDVVNPDGDLDAMNELWSLLTPGGILVLGIPVGNDCVVFNTHRVYGRRRLPLLLRGWSVVEARGLPASDAAAGKLFAQGGCPSDHVVTLVLRRTVPNTHEEEWKRVPGLHGVFPVHA